MVKHSIEKQAERSDSKYKGVRKRKWGKWVSEIRLPNSRERIWLGSYDAPEKAARAFDAAQFCLRGRTANFNFPENPPEIADGRSLAPHEIQAAAARFANSEPPRSQSDQLVPELQKESHSQSPPSPLMSDITIQIDSSSTDFGLDWSNLDLLTTMGSGNYPSDYGLFPEFDDLSNDFFAPNLSMPAADYGDENFDGILPQESFLWNF